MDLKKIKDVRWILAWIILTGLTVLFCIQAVFPVYAEEEGRETFFYTDQQGIRYELYDNGTCIVDGYTQDLLSSVRIPIQIHDEDADYNVKGLGEAAFKECQGLKTIDIPNSVTDIPAGVFSDCSRLQDIFITVVDASVKKSAKNMVISAKMNRVPAEEAGRLKWKVDEEILKKAVSKKGADTVTLFLSADRPEKSDEKGIMPVSILLRETDVRAIAGSGKNFKVRIKDAAGGSRYMKIRAADLKQADGMLALTLLDKKSGDISGSLRSDVKKVLQKNGIEADRIKILDVSLGNGVQIKADVIVQAADVRGMKAGSQVHVYRYEKKKRTFAETSIHPYTVSKQGSLTIPVSKDSILLVSKAPLRSMVRKLANEFVTESDRTYYVGKDGNVVCGWRKIGGEYYYFDRENGKMSSGGKVDAIKINKNGTAEKTEANVQKIQTMMKARAVMEQVTNTSDSRSQKIEKCFRWIFQFPYRRYRRLKPIYKEPGWEVTFANDIFDKHQGCCVSEASAAAFLFHECGYETVYVACDTGHAWVELNGRVYDPLFAEDRGFSQYYNVSYNGYGMRPVEKRKI